MRISIPACAADHAYVGIDLSGGSASVAVLLDGAATIHEIVPPSSGIAGLSGVAQACLSLAERACPALIAIAAPDVDGRPPDRLASDASVAVRLSLHRAGLAALEVPAAIGAVVATGNPSRVHIGATFADAWSINLDGRSASALAMAVIAAALTEPHAVRTTNRQRAAISAILPGAKP